MLLMAISVVIHGVFRVVPDAIVLVSWQFQLSKNASKAVKVPFEMSSSHYIRAA